MAVRLDQVPAMASRPAPPRIWLWLGLLTLLLLACAGATLVFSTPALRQRPMDFWALALGVPLLIWSMLSFGRALLYISQQRAADGWDESRVEDLTRKLRRGRRSQQVLSVSLHTALREPGQEQSRQLDALLSGTKALKTQSSWLDSTLLRHSRLPYGTHEAPEQVLLQVMVQVLADLGKTLAQVPDDTPLALLLEVDSALPEHLLHRVWRQAWSESGIRQSTVPVEGDGLEALDHWLDHRIADQALLLVVAVQFAPQNPEGRAEAAVGLLLGNRLTQNAVPALAYLHRPEAQREPTTEALLQAAHQALIWAPLDGEPIVHAWRSGVGAQHEEAITTVLAHIRMPMPNTQGFCNLDSLLGHPGVASSWLPIAAATQAIARGTGPQFIFSGGSCREAGLWSTVLVPVPPLLTKEY
ncbi:hypothetical protein C1X64_27570 [Pseudomonas sp. GW456-E7]|nr:hypothetical protein C1X64_27570 [Pseudomonas sp. GW456-E7]